MSAPSQIHKAYSYYDQKDEVWRRYRKGRPVPPPSFYSKIFDYHSQHGGHFGTVHDVGAGPGIHTASISQPFEDVLVSDIAKSNIEVARLHLEDHIDKPVIFRISKLEDVDWIENESVDLVFAATVMHLTDFDKAMDSFDRQLKPGGTLAIAAMGYSVWEDERLQSAWQRLFQTAGDLHWIKPTLKQDEATKQAAMRPILCSASAYDAVPLPTTFFEEGALRYKVNFPEGWSWYKCQVSDENEPFVPLWSQIGETDRIAYEQVEGWGTEVVLDGLKEIAESFPGLTEFPEWGECCRVFEEEVGDGKAKGTWPHVLILATKKK